MKKIVLAIAALLAGAAAERAGAPLLAQGGGPAWDANLADVRRVAALMPGRRPLRLNLLKFAESRRTKNFSVQGAAAVPSVQARTAFQVVYADGTVMVDAGMDQQIHRFFGRGVEEPYNPVAAERVRRALVAAKLIIVTHEHGDHVGGVIRSSQSTELAPKTILTSAQVRALTSSPQMPEIRLTGEASARYVVVDYEKYLPVAPGIAAIKAPGHTPGSQMIYVVLDSGREFLLIGDAAWHMDGVRLIRGKDAPWVTEDQASVLAQLRWLNALSRSEPGLFVVASHDEEQHHELVSMGMLGDRFE